MPQPETTRNASQSKAKSRKLPALHFYPGDWKKDLGVQSLQPLERYVWFELLLLMHESEERGVLILNGKPLSHQQIARAINLDNQTLEICLTSILDHGVCGVREDGAIFSRRMVRDEEISQKRIKAGSMGGNPNLVNQKSTKKKKAGYPKCEDENEDEDVNEIEDHKKKEKYGDHVWLSRQEIERLKEKHDQHFIRACIEKLNNWIASNPKADRIRNGKNAAATFRSWVIRAVTEDEEREKAKARNGPRPRPSSNFHNTMNLVKDFIGDEHEQS